MGNNKNTFSKLGSFRNSGILAGLAIASIGAFGVGTGNSVSALEPLENPTISPVYQQYLNDVGAGRGSEWKLVPDKYVSHAFEAGGKGGTQLPESYSLIDAGFGTALKNQGGDSICWAYATVTAMESFIKKNEGVDVELSAKQLDYITASTKYGKKAKDMFGVQRELGSAGNAIHSAVGLRSGSALNKEDAFFAKLKANDSNLKDYNSLNEVNNYGTMFNFPAYNHEMSEEQILGDKAEYLMDGFTFIDENDPDAISKIKEAVYTKGAVYVGTYAPGIEDCWDSTNKTIIDRGLSTCGKENGHAMAIVGWDDDYTYRVPGTTTDKKGAFLLQNSYGKSSLFEDYGMTADSYMEVLQNMGTLDGKSQDEINEMKQIVTQIINNFDAYEYIHLGYDFEKSSENATISFMTIDSVKKNDYDRVFDATDATVTVDNGRLVYSVHSDDVYELSSVALEFLATMTVKVPFAVGIDYDGDLKSDVAGEFVYDAGESGRKVIKFDDPVVVDGDYNIIVDAYSLSSKYNTTNYALVEGNDLVISPIVYANNVEAIAVPDTGASTSESSAAKYAGIVAVAMLVALPIIGTVVAKNRKAFHRVKFNRK